MNYRIRELTNSMDDIIKSIYEIKNGGGDEKNIPLQGGICLSTGVIDNVNTPIPTKVNEIIFTDNIMPTGYYGVLPPMISGKVISFFIPSSIVSSVYIYDTSGYQYKIIGDGKNVGLKFICDGALWHCFSNTSVNKSDEKVESIDSLNETITITNQSFYEVTGLNSNYNGTVLTNSTSNITGIIYRSSQHPFKITNIYDSIADASPEQYEFTNIGDYVIVSWDTNKWVLRHTNIQ